ncbi:MAG: alpha/beta hydrolase-fold protein [Pseudomonadota bacterium]
MTRYPAGELVTLTIEGTSLKNNTLGDPTTRACPVYVPRGSDGAGLPLLIDLAAYTSSGLAHIAWKNFGENLPKRIDRLIATEKMKPAVIAMPDCFTSLGGNQYLNNPVLGNWEDFLIADLLPAVEGRFDCGGPGRRGLFGKSSGAYGALVNAMRHPDTWSAAACHAGDMGFDLVYGPELPALLRHLERHDRSPTRFLDAFAHKDRPSGHDITALMMLAMAVSYDPDPAAPYGVRLPVDPNTCEILSKRWQAWLAWDPITLAAKHMDDLKSLDGLWIDCGVNDEYNLLYGARRLHRALKAEGVAHVYDEFDGTHSGIDYRLDESLPFLTEALTPS